MKQRASRREGLWILCLLLLVGMTCTTYAAGPLTGTWNVDADGTWTTATNWDTNPNIPQTDKDTAIFGNVITADRTVTLGGNISIRYLTFNDNNQYTITGANTLLIDGPGANGGVITQSGSGTAVIASTVNNGANAAKVMLWDGAGTGQLTISGVVTGAAQITKSGTSTYVLSGNNTFTGAVTINGGSIIAAHANAFGTTAGGVTVANGAAVGFQGGVSVGAEPMTVNGTGISSTGAIRNISGDNSFAGTISIQSASSFGSDSGTLTLSGVISSTGANTFTKVGAGTIQLTGANTFVGATIINAGTLDLAGSGALASTASVTVNNGGTLLYSGTTTTRIGDTVGITLAGGSTLQSNDATETAGALTLTGAATVILGTDGGNDDITFSSLVDSGGSVTIYNWSGVIGTSGTDDRIFITGATPGTIFGDVQFNGFGPGGIILATGELVPIPEPATVMAGALLLALVGLTWIRSRTGVLERVLVRIRRRP